MAVDMEACMKAGTPGEAHQKLEQFTGTWKASVKHWMAPGTDPQQSTGSMTNTWMLGNRFLCQDYKSDVSGPPFEGHGLMGYNNVTGHYEGFWVDSMSTGMSTDVGDCDEAGKVWTMTGEMEFPTAGSKFSKKSVITVNAPDSHTMEMFMSGPDGGEFFKTMEIVYTR